MRRKKKKLNKLDKYIIFSLIFLVTYTIIEQYLTVKTGFERSTLSTCVHSTFGGELLGCVILKVANIRHEDDIKHIYLDEGEDEGNG